VSNTANSNNSSNSNVNNTIDNSNSGNTNTTLNNTGSITYNDNSKTNVDVTVNNTSKEENNYYKQLKDDEKKSNEVMKTYYQKQLDEATSDLEQAKKDLTNIQSQKTVKTLKQQADGSWQYVGEVDKNAEQSAKQEVKRCEDNVEYYEKLVKQYS
jgi:hypothetical protein